MLLLVILYITVLTVDGSVYLTFSEIMGHKKYGVKLRNSDIYIFEFISLVGRDYEKQKLNAMETLFQICSKFAFTPKILFTWIEFTHVPEIYRKFENAAFLLHRTVILRDP